VQKIDLKRQLANLYNPSARDLTLVDVPAMNFLMIDGMGDPSSSQEYQEAVEALYTLSYSIKFAVRKSQGEDYTVMPLEGLWWADDMMAFQNMERSVWRWSMMIMQPPFVSRDQFEDVLPQVIKKKGCPSLEKACFESFHEGLSLQILHFGPYAAEAPTIVRIHQYIAERGYQTNGHHHEIYLGDPRRTVPERLKTVLRQPIRKN
jgi:hypothetical protein